MVTTESGLSLWVIYDHPRDHPDWFVARRWENDRPTDEIVLACRLEQLRKTFARMGKVRIARDMHDDPAIVESWL